MNGAHADVIRERLRKAHLSESEIEEVMRETPLVGGYLAAREAFKR